MVREAAVAAIVHTVSSPEILILKRTFHPEDPWSGHYSFPGGRKDKQDSSLFETCLRETSEECGIVIGRDELVKEYPSRAAGNSMGLAIPVTAYLFEVSDRPEIALQQSEIAAYEWLNLEYAANRANIIHRSMSPRSPDRLYPCLPASQGVVWGFTFDTLMDVIADRYAPASQLPKNP